MSDRQSEHVRIERGRIASMLDAEQRRFDATHPRSRERFAAGGQHWLYGAPSHWMRRWAGGAPLSIERARGTRLLDADGHEYVDFCLGDTGGLCGHGNPAIAEAVHRQLAAGGASMMLPTPDAAWVGHELARRFGLPFWGMTTSATDANRACIRLARMVTGRDKVLVFSGCYHGGVDEAHVELRDGEVRLRNDIHPNGVDHARVSKVVEFNDLPALEAALADRDVACVLAEPAMTNYGLILPERGFMDALRAATTATGTLLLIDETHTISSGPGGATRAWNLRPDMFVLGKAVGGGIPCAAFGVSAPTAERVWSVVPRVPPTVRQSAHLGFGGTLAGNAVSVAAMRAVLEHVWTDASFERMHALAERLATGIAAVATRAGLPWHVARLGARIETLFAAEAPRDAARFRAARDPELEMAMHLFLLNRGVLITPFHNMLLTCPASTEADVELHDQAFGEFVATLTAA